MVNKNILSCLMRGDVSPPARVSVWGRLTSRIFRTFTCRILTVNYETVFSRRWVSPQPFIRAGRMNSSWIRPWTVVKMMMAMMMMMMLAMGWWAWMSSITTLYTYTLLYYTENKITNACKINYIYQFLSTGQKSTLSPLDHQIDLILPFCSSHIIRLDWSKIRFLSICRPIHK